MTSYKENLKKQIAEILAVYKYNKFTKSTEDFADEVISKCYETAEKELPANVQGAMILLKREFADWLDEWINKDKIDFYEMQNKIKELRGETQDKKAVGK